MPSDEDRDNQIETETHDEPEHKAETPTFSLDGMEDRISAGITRGMAGLFQQNRPVPTDPELERLTITDEDDDQTRMEKVIHNQLIPMKRQMTEFRNFGLDKLGSLNTHVASTTLKYFNKYKGEIEGELSKLDPALRADQSTVKLVHDTIVARHVDEIAEERAQETRRSILQANEAPKPGGGSGRFVGQVKAGVPTPEDLGFDNDQLRMIEERGGPDSFARRVSNGRFASWEDYAKSRASMDSQPRREGRTVIPFKRATIKKAS